jgi:large subunit ribosomal protein L21
MATVQQSGKGKKVIAYKFKAKVRYRRKLGHRQPFTTILIDKIVAPGMVKAKPASKTSRKSEEVTADGA